MNIRHVRCDNCLCSVIKQHTWWCHSQSTWWWQYEVQNTWWWQGHFCSILCYGIKFRFGALDRRKFAFKALNDCWFRSTSSAYDSVTSKSGMSPETTTCEGWHSKSDKLVKFVFYPSALISLRWSFLASNQASTLGRLSSVRRTENTVEKWCHFLDGFLFLLWKTHFSETIFLSWSSHTLFLLRSTCMWNSTPKVFISVIHTCNTAHSPEISAFQKLVSPFQYTLKEVLYISLCY